MDHQRLGNRHQGVGGRRGLDARQANLCLRRPVSAEILESASINMSASAYEKANQKFELSLQSCASVVERVFIADDKFRLGVV